MSGNKLNLKTKIFYGIGGICDNAVYTLSGTYLLIFLTTVAGVSPAAAGTITAVGAFWEAILGPVLGFRSDETVTRFGRRKPYLMVSAIPVAVVTWLLFTTIDASNGVKIIYYWIMMVLFETFFTMEFVPYLSWGADLTEDYNERTVLRSFAYFFNQIGMLIGMVMPAVIVEWSSKRGSEPSGAWQNAGLFVGVCAGLALVLCSLMIRQDDRDPKDPDFIREKREQRERRKSKAGVKNVLKEVAGMLRQYFTFLKLKPIQRLIGASMTYLIANTIFSSARVFYMTYNLGTSQSKVSLMMLLITVSGVIFVPLVARVATHTDKSEAFRFGIGISGVLMVLLRFIRPESFPMAYCTVVCLVYSVANTCYWQLMPSMIYDVCEVEELESGESHSGAVISLQAFSESVCIALGFQILGLILDLSGFDESVQAIEGIPGIVSGIQPVSALNWVGHSFTLIPGMFMILTFFIMAGYPITKEKFLEIRTELEKRRNSRTIN